MKTIDQKVSNSVTRRFIQNYKDLEREHISETTLTPISNSLTALQNSFAAIATHHENISNIRKAESKGISRKQDEQLIESYSQASQASFSSNGATGISSEQMKGLTEALTSFGKKFEEFAEVQNTSDQTGGGLFGGGGFGGRGALIAGGAIAAAGVAGFMMSSSAEATEPEEGPEPEPDIAPSEPPPRTPTVAQPQVKPPAPKEPAQPPPAQVQSAATKVSYQPTSESQATPVLNETERANAGRYTNKLTNYVKGSVRTIEKTKSLWERIFGSRSETGDDSGYEDYGSTGGAGGGAINPPTSGMAGAIYQAAKQRGYDDHMAIAFVSVAEKESGLRPQAENMNYRPERAREIFGAAAVPYTGNPRRFANYVYGPSTRKGRQLGNTGPEDGWNYRGKGFIQVTGKNNYRALSRVIGYDLIKDPDALINNSEIAIKGLFGFYESPSLGGSVVRGKKTARSQGEANRILTDATGGRVGFSSGSAFGRENLAKVNRFSARYTAGGLASSASDTSSAGDTPRRAGGGEVVNTDNIREAIRGKSIWSYARKKDSGVDWMGLKQGMKDRFMAMAIDYHQQTGNKVQINSANRTYAKQAELYRRYGPRRAAPPGRSKHESGVAIDIQSTDAQRMIQLGLFEKYGFYRPYRSETWHIEPTEASRVRGQPDNPYQPGDAIAQTNRGGSPVIQTDTGATKPVSNETSQLGERAAGVAIQTRQAGQSCPTTIVPVAVGSGGTPQNPASYLTGTKAPPRGSGRNSAMDYKVYFNAA